MRSALRLPLVLAFALAALPALAGPKHVRWTARLEPADIRAGESAQIILTADIDDNWHFYSATTPPNGPKPMKVELKSGSKFTANGALTQPTPNRKKDELFEDAAFVEFYEKAAAFGLPVKLDPGATGSQTATVVVKYQVCDPKQCVDETVELPVTTTVGTGPARSDRIAAGKGAASDTANKLQKAKESGILAFVWLSMLAGLASIFTPCVFPMVPITVSFFSKQKAAGGSKYAGPIAYCLGIIGTFTGLGVAVTVIFGAAGINRLAANPWVNLGLATVFIVLAASLFGAFEIVLPTWVVNRAHQGTTKGGLIGPVLMGLTFTLTSFTCTVPVAGTLLASAATGSLLYPIIGMLAFSTAFAMPFFFLALFPQYLAKLPKSGSWLVSVKAVMGFLELAAALKFISNVDLVWGLGYITRPVFLAIWAAIGVVCGIYLLGWLRLPHDDGVKVGWPRRFIGVLAAVAGVYCLAAMNGASLGQLEAFPPPEPYPGKEAMAGKGGSAKQIALLLPWVYKYDEALAQAKATNKAMFLNFTGVT